MAQKSVFIEFMGDSPTVRVLDYLLTEQCLDFSITDLAKNAGVGRATLYRIWDALIKHEIIIPTRIIGKAKLYKLNTKNTAIKKLLELDDALIVAEVKNRIHKKAPPMVVSVNA